MTIINSVRFKIFFGFVLVVAPLVFFLMYNNVYSMNVVRDQVSVNYSNLLNQYANGTDNTLKEFDNYLFHLSSDPDVINMQVYPSTEDEYVLAKQRLYNKFSKQINSFNLINTCFIYSSSSSDLLVTTPDNNFYYDRLKTTELFLKHYLETESHEYTSKWNMLRSESGEVFLVQMVDLGLGFTAGIMVQANAMITPLSGWEVGENGGVLLVDNAGKPLTDKYFPDDRYRNLTEKNGAVSRAYQIVEDQETSEQFLMVSRFSGAADFQYVLIIAEKSMLQNLPYLQLAIYFLPLGGAFVLGIYLLYLQTILFKPMTQLMRGMRKIGQGELNVRLNEASSTEFAFLITTFNNMVQQIENLKISVYEEKLRVQQAEFKHLQVQINPHFYMNSLNIIYNLAALKDTKSVQKMALHLADYFRFIMRTNRTTMTLQDEVQHIRNYLEIQMLRYPDILNFAIQVPDKYGDYGIPPLTVQPFVENAVIHGFTKERGKFCVEIAAEEDPQEPERFFIVSIADNGRGFSADMLERLNSEQYLQESGDDHLGVWNVRHRLRMNFGEAVTIAFANRPEGGAVVQIRLPLKAAVNQGEESHV